MIFRGIIHSNFHWFDRVNARADLEGAGEARPSPLRSSAPSRIDIDLNENGQTMKFTTQNYLY